ncbi:hypothetical protein AMECASPLE_034487 [Ameca splendens]|uniref:Uncharacterized protein n=1 Tax=Ameca splendens TaxID=208324 RepID=A0ABV0YU81_9TELE
MTWKSDLAVSTINPNIQHFSSCLSIIFFLIDCSVYLGGWKRSKADISSRVLYRDKGQLCDHIYNLPAQLFQTASSILWDSKDELEALEKSLDVNALYTAVRFFQKCF